MKEKVNWNTLLISIGLAVGAGTFAELRSTHDSIIKLQMKVDGYDTELIGIKTRLAAVEVEIEKIKQKEEYGR